MAFFLCTIGQDATVDYPSTDFQFKNSSDYPVYIKAYMDGRTLVVQIYGHPSDEWDTIEVESWQTGVIPPPPTEYIVDESLPEARSHGGPTPAMAIPQRAKRCFIKTARRSKGSQLIPRITWRAPRSIK